MAEPAVREAADVPVQQSSEAEVRRRPARVLYVEDNPANMRLMEEVMADMGGLELLTAHNAEIGLHLAEVERPDLIILDINLPGLNGFQALRRLRDDPALAAVPAIALSANATATAVQKGRDAGFDAYLTKPVVIPELMHAIDAALAGRTAP